MLVLIRRRRRVVICVLLLLPAPRRTFKLARNWMLGKRKRCGAQDF